MNLDFDGIKSRYGEFENIFSSGDYKRAHDMLSELIKELEASVNVRRAAKFTDDGQFVMSTPEENKDSSIYISINHVMEYYIYAFYYKPDADVKCTEIPIGEYLRRFGELGLKLGKYNSAAKAFSSAAEWNPTDLDAILGLAECYKYLGMTDRYLAQTKNAHRYCCTRATMARYYRNMGFVNISKYNTELARACYLYSNIYYHTENADSELKYLCEALNNKTPDYSIREMQQMFDKAGIEPGPDPDTVGVIYRVGELMMEDKEYGLAKDCFLIVQDITGEEKLDKLLEELDKMNT